MRKRSRTWASIGRKPWARRAPAASAAIAAWSRSRASTRARRARSNVKVPTPQKRSATRLAAPDGAHDETGHHPFRFLHRLHEGARGDGDVDPGGVQRRGRALDDGVPVDGDARQPVLRDDAGDRGSGGRLEAASPGLDGDIQAGGRRQHGEAHLRRRKRCRDRPQGRKLRADFRNQHRALLDVDKIEALAPVVAESDAPALPPCRQNGAAARARRHATERGHLGGEAALAQRGNDDVALPLGIEALAHVLGDAPSADPEMAADRGLAIGARSGQQPERARRARRHAFPRQSEGDIDPPRTCLGDAVALRAERGNLQLIGFRHDGRSRLHPARAHVRDLFGNHPQTRQGQPRSCARIGGLGRHLHGATACTVGLEDTARIARDGRRLPRRAGRIAAAAHGHLIGVRPGACIRSAFAVRNQRHHRCRPPRRAEGVRS